MPEVRQTLTPQKNGRSVVFIRTLASDGAALAKGVQPQPAEVPLTDASIETTEDQPLHKSSTWGRQLLILFIVLCIGGAGYVFFWPTISRSLFGE